MYLRIIFSFLLISAFFASQGQTTFTIRGKIDRLSKSRSVIINGSSGAYEGLINSDGSFEIKGNASEPGAALIKTDSSGNDAIWITPGEYIIECKEITIPPGKNYYLRIPILTGPPDAEIYHGFSQPMYYPKGNPKEYIRNHFSGYIDSIFKVNPTTLVLPEMIRFATPHIGKEAVAFFSSLLSNEQKADSSASQLTYYLKREEKIKKEVFFSDFQMMDVNQKSFKLSSLQKKLILIDFWSSDCYPCRKKHEKLVKLYKKYASKGLEIVSISLDNERAAWLKAIQADEMTWINVSELKGWETSIAESYFVKSLPYSIWIVRGRKILSEEMTEEEIESYLK